MHVHLSAVTPADHRPGTVRDHSKDRSRTAQPVAEPEGRRPLQGRTLRERHHRSDGRDCRQQCRHLRARRRCCLWHHLTAPPLRHRPRGHGPGRAAAGRVRPRHQGHRADAQEPADRGHQGGAGRQAPPQAARAPRRRRRPRPSRSAAPPPRPVRATSRRCRAEARPRRPRPSSRSTSPASRPATTSRPASAAVVGPPRRRAARTPRPRPRPSGPGRASKTDVKARRPAGRQGRGRRRRRPHRTAPRAAATARTRRPAR